VADSECALRWRATAGQGGAFSRRPLSAREAITTLLSPLAHGLRKQGRFEGRIAAALLASPVNAEYAEAWNNLCLLHRSTDNRELAFAASQRAFKTQPASAEAHNNLGVIAETNEETTVNFRQAVTPKPKLGAAWRNLWVAYRLSGQGPRAPACFEKCRQLSYPVDARPAGEMH